MFYAQSNRTVISGRKVLTKDQLYYNVHDVEKWWNVCACPDLLTVYFGDQRSKTKYYVSFLESSILSFGSWLVDAKQRTHKLKQTCQPARFAGKATLTSSLLLGKCKVLRSLRHYLLAQSERHHTTNRLEERGSERGSARRSSLKGRERAIVSQTNIGTVSKATLGKLLRVWVKRIRAFPSA